MFNPGAFMSNSLKAEVAHASRSALQDKEYKLTGNNTRDQVRKLLFEALSEADTEPTTLAPEELTELLETALFDLCADAKSKEYRDKSRTAIQKLKVLSVVTYFHTCLFFSLSKLEDTETL